MELPGRVQNGVVVLTGGPPLPDGLAVTVVCPSPAGSPAAGGPRPVVLPLVPSQRPGSVRLTAERVAELLDEPHVPA
jgi:hypothetical protein